jgi:hypothetical protein
LCAFLHLREAHDEKFAGLNVDFEAGLHKQGHLWLAALGSPRDGFRFAF